MNSEDKIEHLQEEIRLLKRNLKELESFNDTVYAIALIAHALALKSSNLKDIKDILKKVLEKHVLSKKNQKFIKRLIENTK